ncbi:hypothetical protein GGX14DRAFT_402551 [Mycena pura]|uniref:Uncharacterized protein n=1 Tax=Mycena pura TaxID=153505 RepID=A0AAD6Y9E4_9AGAR|nr:hypothetical protein GGX14DRAFT_402551 [Mycena pura]
MTLDAFECDENDTDAAHGQQKRGRESKERLGSALARRITRGVKSPANCNQNVASSSTKGLRAAISSTDWRGMALTLTWTPESVSAMGVRATLCGTRGARADVERIVWRWKMDLALTRILGTDGGETGTGRAWAELERPSGYRNYLESHAVWRQSVIWRRRRGTGGGRYYANWRIGEEKERAGNQYNIAKSQTRVFGAATRSLRCEGDGRETETARVRQKLGIGHKNAVSTFGGGPSMGKSRKPITSSHMRSAGVQIRPVAAPYGNFEGDGTRKIRVKQEQRLEKLDEQRRTERIWRKEVTGVESISATEDWGVVGHCGFYGVQKTAALRRNAPMSGPASSSREYRQ